MEAKDAEGVAHLLQIKAIAAKEGPLIDDEKETEQDARDTRTEPNRKPNQASVSSGESKGGSAKHGFGKAFGEDKARKSGDAREPLKKAKEIDLGREEKKKPAAFPSPNPAAVPAAARRIQDSKGPTKIPSKKPAPVPLKSSPPKASPPKAGRRQLATRGSVAGSSRKKKAAGAAVAEAKSRDRASPATLPRHRLLASPSPASKQSKASTPTPTSGRRTRRSAAAKKETSDGCEDAAEATKKAPPVVTQKAAPAVTKKKATIERKRAAKSPAKPPALSTPSRRSTRSSSSDPHDDVPEPSPKRRSTRTSTTTTGINAIVTSGVPAPSPLRARPTKASLAKKDPPPAPAKSASGARISRLSASRGAAPPSPPDAWKKNRAATAAVAVVEAPSPESKRASRGGVDAPPESEGSAAKRSRCGDDTTGDDAAAAGRPSAEITTARPPTRRSSRKSVPSIKSIEAAVSELCAAPPATASTLVVEGGALESTAAAASAGGTKKKKKKERAAAPAKKERAAAAAPAKKERAAAAPAKSAEGRSFDSMWVHHLDKLLEFKDFFGHMMVPKKYPADQPLSTWVFRQRQERNRYQSRKPTTLTKERIERLNEVGFVWRPKETEEYKILEAARKRAVSNKMWDERFAELLEFKKTEGHTLVPKHYPHNSPLAQWVHRVRTTRKKQLAGEDVNLSEEQVSRLERVGFVWDAKQDPRFKEIEADRKRPQVQKLWETYFKQLKEFKSKEGHCIVPKKYLENQPLASWVAKQRQNYRLKKEGKYSIITDDKIRRLEAEGFVFANTRNNNTFHKIEQVRRKPQADALWNKRYRQLLAYKKKKGHTIVPKNYPSNPILSHWVFRQRASYRLLRSGKHSPLTEEHIRTLDKVGFVWVMRQPTGKGKKEDDDHDEDEDEVVTEVVADVVGESDDENEDSDDDSSSSSSSSSSDASSSDSSSGGESSDDESSASGDEQETAVGGSESRKKSSEGKANKEEEQAEEESESKKSSAASGEDGWSSSKVSHDESSSPKQQQAAKKTGETGEGEETTERAEEESKESAGSARRKSSRKRHDSYEDKFGCYIKE